MEAVTEDVKWGNDLVFSVGDKMFFVVGLEETPVTASFKVADEDYEEMCSRPGFKPAPYLARYKWVFIDDVNKIKNSEWNTYLLQSYNLVKEKLAPKKRKELGLT